MLFASHVWALWCSYISLSFAEICDIILITVSQICSGLALVRDVTMAMTSVVEHVTAVPGNRYDNLLPSRCFSEFEVNHSQATEEQVSF